jgi:hypothetical protein
MIGTTAAGTPSSSTARFGGRSDGSRPTSAPTLRRSCTAAHWSFETLDGRTAITGGHSTDRVGTSAAAGIFGSQLHAYYYDQSRNDLRHAWWDGRQWNTETLDGDVSNAAGRIAGDVGLDVSVLNAGGPHIWYHDQGNGDLRHAWWTGSQWRYETLDGDANVATTGRILGSVGAATSAVLFGGQPHVWYHDESNGDLRHAWWTGTEWHYETLDGAGGVHGERATDVGADTTATVINGAPHVFYHDVTAGDLRHTWWNGTGWSFETVDGVSGPAGRVPDDVGAGAAVTVYANQLHVWYRDNANGSLHHAWHS